MLAMEHPDYTFERFVMHDESRDAVSACMAVAERPGEVHNPLFVVGPTESGKTHLLHAIAHRMRAVRPELEVKRVATGEFIGEMVQAIRADAMPAFEEDVARCGALLVDDIWVLRDKERSRIEFFHVIALCVQRGVQVVLACDTPPSERFDNARVVTLRPIPRECRFSMRVTLSPR